MSHAFVPHLWKKGTCRECTLPESEHVGAVAAAATAPPPPLAASTPTAAAPPAAAAAAPAEFHRPQLPATSSPQERIATWPPPPPPMIPAVPPAAAAIVTTAATVEVPPPTRLPPQRMPPPMPPPQRAPPPMPVPAPEPAPVEAIAMPTRPPPIPTSISSVPPVPIAAAAPLKGGPPPRPAPVLRTAALIPPPLPAQATPAVAAVSSAPVVPLSSPPPVPSAAPPPPPSSTAHRLIDYFAVFGRGAPILDDVVSPDLTLQQLRFHSTLLPLQRYPATDHRDSALSGNTNCFCFPSHITLQITSLRDIDDQYSSSFLGRRPGLHRFVLTKLDGSKQFCSTLTVWERMSDRDIDSMFDDVEVAARARQAHATSPATFTTALMASLRSSLQRRLAPATLFAPKALTIVSSWPFFSLAEEFLKALYRVAHSGLTEATIREHARARLSNVSIETAPSAFSLVHLATPLERLLANFVCEVPVPPPGMAQVRYSPPGSSRDGAALLISRPPVNQLPMCDVDWALLFRAIDHATLIAIFVAVATEQKVLLVSRHRNLISATCDAIAALLFPFAWAGVYMPLLPEPMLGFLHAPVPFVAGISAATYLSRAQEIPTEELVLVELDERRIRMPEADTLPHLPEGPYKKLLAHLKEHADIACVSHPLVALSDQAFPFNQDLFKLDCDELLPLVELENIAPVPRHRSIDHGRYVSPPPPVAPPASVPTAYKAAEPTHTSTVRRPGLGSRRASLPGSISPSAAEATLAPNLAVEETALRVEEVRYGFLRLWCKLLARYDKYMPWGEFGGGSSSGSPPSSPGGGASAASGQADDWFNTAGFLAASPRDARPFLTIFTASQMFAKFIDDRMATRDDIEAWSNKKAAAADRAQARGGALSDNEDAESDSDGDGGDTIAEGDEGDDDARSYEPTEVSRSKPSASGTPTSKRPHRRQLSSSSGLGHSTPVHSRPASWSPDLAATSAHLPACDTVAPPSFASAQIDASDPVAMPVLHQIQFFGECLRAQKNRRRLKLGGRIFGSKAILPTPFLHDSTTATERVVDTWTPNATGLPEREYGYPVLRTAPIPAGASSNSVAVFPVFPTLDPALFGTPRPTPSFSTAIAITPLTVVTGPLLSLPEDEAPPKSLSSMPPPPPGRVRGGGHYATLPASLSISTATPGFTPDNYVVATPASKRTIVGERGSFSAFHRDGIQGRINHMASVLSFDSFGAPVPAAGAVRTGPAKSILISDGVPLSQLPVSSKPPPSIGNKQLHKLMEKEREKQAKLDKKRAKEAAKQEERARKDELTISKTSKTSKKTSVVWTPPVYSSSQSVTVQPSASTNTTPVSGVGSGVGTQPQHSPLGRRAVGSSIFSFAPGLGAAPMSANFGVPARATPLPSSLAPSRPPPVPTPYVSQSMGPLSAGMLVRPPPRTQESTSPALASPARQPPPRPSMQMHQPPATAEAAAATASSPPQAKSNATMPMPRKLPPPIASIIGAAAAAPATHDPTRPPPGRRASTLPPPGRPSIAPPALPVPPPPPPSRKPPTLGQ